MPNTIKFIDLPTELIVMIFGMLDFPDIRRCRLACQRFRSTIDDPVSKIAQFNANVASTEDARTLLSSCQEFESATLLRLNEELPSMTMSRNLFPRIKKVDLQVGNSGLNTLKVLQYGCEFAEEINIAPLALASVGSHRIARIIPEIRFEYLVCLSLRVVRYQQPTFIIGNSSSHCIKLKKTVAKNEDEHTLGVETIFKLAKIPTLKKLKFLIILIFEEITGLHGIVNLLYAFYKFVDWHTSSLRNLDLTLRCGPNVDILNNNTNYFPASLSKSISENLKLDSFKFTGEEKALRIVPFITSCSLKELYFNQSYGETNENQLKMMQDIIVHNEDTLTKLEVRVSMFDMESVRNCHSLTELTLDVLQVANERVDVPTVRTLKLNLTQTGSNHLDEIQWIINSFKNVEQISLVNEAVVDILSVDGLKALFTLPKWQEIEYTTVASDYNKLFNVGPDSLQVFCSQVEGVTLKASLVSTRSLFRHLQVTIQKT